MLSRRCRAPPLGRAQLVAPSPAEGGMMMAAGTFTGREAAELEGHRGSNLSRELQRTFKKAIVIRAQPLIDLEMFTAT